GWGGGALLEGAGGSVRGIVKRESGKGGRADGMKFCPPDGSSAVKNPKRNEMKLSEPMAIGFNSPKAFGGGNWRKKLKWQIQINWLSNSVTSRCWRLLDWSSSLRRNGV